MFYNLRFLTLLGSLIIMLITGAFSAYLEYYIMENVVRSMAQEKAEQLGQDYTQDIWNRYYPVIAFLSTKQEADYASVPQYAAYTKDSAPFFNDPTLLSVNIISTTGGGTFYKTDVSVREQNSWFSWSAQQRVTQNLQHQASTQGIVSGILYNAAIVGGKHNTETRTVLRVLVPIKPTQVASEYADAGERSKASLILDYDIQSYASVMRDLSIAVLTSMLALLAVLNAYIYRSSKNAESLIEKQQENSLEMAAAKDEAESEAKNKAKFIANVSHELRTPLNAIIGFSDMIRTESMGPIGHPQYKEFIEDIHTSGEHLLALINDILDFSKAEENKLTVDSEPVDMTKLVEMSLRMVTPRAEQSKVTLAQQVPAEHILAMGDPKRLKQALLNLLSNSVKFTPEGGKVTVRLSTDMQNQRVIMEVADNGVGMAPQDLARAMSPFGQVDNKLSKRYEGTGLGLPLTKKLVELMQGIFEIKSEVGLGTTIRISLPIGKL